ncbi:MAG: hypothetical protein OXC37_00260, partial [Bdellovibrionaceae bacterium]|nr:hypothetical protein [Pseudobdellovibrionaceae bacterium]
FAFTSIYLAALSAQKEDSVMDEYTQETPDKPVEQEANPESSPVEEQAPLPSSQNVDKQKKSDVNKSNNIPSNKVDSPSSTQPKKE